MNGVDRLYSVLLYVRILETSLKFYRDRLGLRQLGPVQDGVAILDAGGPLIVLHTKGSSNWPAPGVDLKPGGHALTFHVDDPDAWARELEVEGISIIGVR